MPTTPERIKAIFDHSSLTLAVAESASGGHLSSLLTAISGSSSYFRGGVIAYHIDVKVNLLGVDEQHAASVNCVSAPVAKEMATGVRKLLDTEVGISITGYAEPDAAGDTYAWIGFDVWGHVWAERCTGPESAWLSSGECRVATQDEYAQMALEGLCNYLDALKAEAPIEANERLVARLRLSSAR